MNWQIRASFKWGLKVQTARTNQFIDLLILAQVALFVFAQMFVCQEYWKAANDDELMFLSNIKLSL